jgi:hypothetical protein
MYVEVVEFRSTFQLQKRGDLRGDIKRKVLTLLSF